MDCGRIQLRDMAADLAVSIMIQNGGRHTHQEGSVLGLFKDQCEPVVGDIPPARGMENKPSGR